MSNDKRIIAHKKPTSGFYGLVRCKQSDEDLAALRTVVSKDTFRSTTMAAASTELALKKAMNDNARDDITTRAAKLAVVGASLAAHQKSVESNLMMVLATQQNLQQTSQATAAKLLNAASAAKQP